MFRRRRPPIRREDSLQVLVERLVATEPGDRRRLAKWAADIGEIAPYEVDEALRIAARLDAFRGGDAESDAAPLATSATVSRSEPAVLVVEIPELPERLLGVIPIAPDDRIGVPILPDVAIPIVPDEPPSQPHVARGAPDGRSSKESARRTRRAPRPATGA